MKTYARLFVPLLLVIGLMCIAASVALAQSDEEEPETVPDTTEEAQESTADESDDEDGTAPSQAEQILDDEVTVAIEPTGNNGYCTICHDQPLRTQRLEDGTILNLYVNPAMVAASVHGPTEDSPGLGCLDCHGEDAFPHSDPAPTNGRVYTLESVNYCYSCHETQAADLDMGLHSQAISEGNLEAAVCTDCHGAHHIQSAENFPDLVAGVCGDCHENTLAEWQISPHVDIGPLGCAACHNHHGQTLRVGETSTDLCLNCHGDMPSFHAHDTHLNVENPVACVDCHMYMGETDALAQNISVIDAQSTGHSMLLDAAPCTTCHANLDESGEWATIISNRYGVDATTEDMQETITDPESVEEVDAADDDGEGIMQTIQGLLVGLGLGVTFAIVFVTRSVRSNNKTEDDEDDNEEA